MTENWALNWAIMALSIFNMVLLLWLGLTVLLNAERRTWGVWLAGSVILLGGIFFLAHTILLGYGLNALERGIDFWWRIGWLPVVAIPYIWYVMVLWYAGFWDRFGANLNRRHYPWFVGITLMAGSIFLLLAFANPLPSFIQVAQLNLKATPAIQGIPLLILVYPVYILLCITLSIDVLRRPAPSGRIMGDLARRRARPWLIGAALTQIAVSLLVGWVMVWAVSRARVQVYNPSMATTIAVFDLVIAALIALAVVLLGQAVTSYEVFTGKSLPRHGLLRYWQRATILAGGYALVISLSLAVNLHPVYGAILGALLMTIYFAVLNWQSISERQTFINQLRPFVRSPGVYDQLLAQSPLEVETQQPFAVLCQDVLGAQRAYLAAQGPLAAFAGEPLVFSPTGEISQPVNMEGLVGPWLTPESICIPINTPNLDNPEWRWLVPLWSERGLIGALALGSKADGGLYTQEEIEIARTVGERLIDTRASAEIARRLVTLQRQRLAESQVLDQRTRRVLHDDVLPQLHTALLTLRAADAEQCEALDMLANTHHQISDLLREMPTASAPELGRLGLVAMLRKTTETEFQGVFDQVCWGITDGTADDLAQLPPLVAEVVYFAAREAMRNAARHAAGDGHAEGGLPTLRLAVMRDDQGWRLMIEDDGAARGTASITAGVGQGLTLHGTMMAVIGGGLAFEQGENGARVVLHFPGR